MFALSVCPTDAVPEILGRPLLTGGELGGWNATAGVWLLLAGADVPAAFEALTDARSVLPASASTAM